MRVMGDANWWMKLVCVGALMILGAGAAFAQTAATHPFGVDDYSALRSASARAVSPDGKWVLVRVSWDGDRGPAKREFYLMDTNGENKRKLELPEGFEPRNFMKDGSLYGDYSVAGKGQLGVMPLEEGKATRIIALTNGVHAAQISPDGMKFAAMSDPSPKDELADVRHVVENDVTRLYVVNADGTGGAWWCPKIGDIQDFAWSADSSTLAVMTQYPKLGHHDVHSMIWTCSATSAHQVAEVKTAVSGIAWSGAKELAFASTTTTVLTPDHLWTVSTDGGEPVDRTPKLEGSIGTVWNDVVGGTVWVEMHKGTVMEPYAWRDGKLTPGYRWPGGVILGPPVGSSFMGATDVKAFTVGDPKHAANVAVSAGGGQPKKITTEGDDTLAKTELGDVKVVNWTAKDGTKLEGILTLPAGYENGKKYPFLVLPHGGPEANDLYWFDWLTRIIAGYGYVVMQPQYRGSTGYGSDFLEAIYQHFGDRAYADVDSSTDFAIQQGWADPQRLAIFGWSAGGFMTSWTVTQTGRYKAAIEGAGITDWLSFIPTSDIAQVDYDLRMQEKDPGPLLKFSAVMHADAVTTPLLILHGEADQRVPMLQGREFFVLLAERGKTVRMVTYPGSPHFPRLAEQRRNVMVEIRDWLGKYNP
jgi:dipeptidyl aminopeptidase/acylaminoacyl peptidase